MKKVGVVIAALLCILLVCGTFFFVKQKASQAQNQQTELTEVQKLITKNIAGNYPSTPREVVKLYNRIITAYYKEDYTIDELSKLADQTLLLFDDELREINDKQSYFMALKADIDDYARRERYIAQSSVCDSRDVLYKTIDEDEIAYVTSSYFVREGTNYAKTYQTYVLRKDELGNWKILVFYQVKGDSSEDD